MAVYKSGAHAYRDRNIATSINLISTTNVAPPDASVPRGSTVIWFDSTAGTPAIRYKSKDAAGTVTTGTL